MTYSNNPYEIDLGLLLQPETVLERQLLQDPQFIQGLFWGTPRYGHPEGQVYKHITEVLANIDRLAVPLPDRRKLRLIALVHDTFKYLEARQVPRDWSRHHGMLARLFMESYTEDPVILDLIELHDEAYYCWRHIHLYQQPKKGARRLEQLLARLGNALQLYYLFFKCDTQTGDKNPAPLLWFESHISGISVIPSLR
ncbi:HD domain-containing protein [Phaeodactylibacter luteus]|uniref:HD domain-containing protein n=1 Tax=Phaeodactylibacter luteus TaxID=1564516 RepID=A0A5C6RH40_9BACT|nr:HD domain-containing protein [Phaeodactylibacter luteus]TXB61384.1 HD domain-containing protein [Phaeodactylibacter luteus]